MSKYLQLIEWCGKPQKDAIKRKVINVSVNSVEFDGICGYIDFASTGRIANIENDILTVTKDGRTLKYKITEED